jgi:hypothetical protein
MSGPALVPVTDPEGRPPERAQDADPASDPATERSPMRLIIFDLTVFSATRPRTSRTLPTWSLSLTEGPQYPWSECGSSSAAPPRCRRPPGRGGDVSLPERV